MSVLIHPFFSETELWNAALRSTLKSIAEALQTHGHARIGLAGGSTPKKLYEMLAHESLPWEKFTFILIDERHVPVTDEESNARMISRALFEPAKIPSETRLLFDTRLTPTEAASHMGQKLQILQKLREPLFDLLILGCGKDGHIASLFEGDPAIAASEWAYPTEAPSEYETTQRLTLSLHTLMHAQKALLLLKGSEKRIVVEALEGEPVLPMTALKKLTEHVPTEVLAYLE